MTEPSLPAPLEESAENHENPAVAACCRAWDETYEEALEAGDITDYAAGKEANQAFREAMPPLIGWQNIRDFIACVACGVLRDVFSGSEVTRLLYAAQVAVSADGSRRSSGRN
jgi:hypothetical protein